MPLNQRSGTAEPGCVVEPHAETPRGDDARSRSLATGARVGRGSGVVPAEQGA
jgi:hypothetical protein